MRNLLAILVIMCHICAVTTVSAGVVLNGSFEDGLTGWTPIGATVEGTIYGTLPTSGSFQGHMLNSHAATPSSIELALGLNAGRLNELAGAGNTVTQGAALYQSINANAGDILSFDWNFLTNETFGAPLNNNDFAFWSITAVVPTARGEVLARASTPTLVSAAVGSGFLFQTGYLSQSFTFAADGDFVLGFGVLQVNDSSTEFRLSSLLVDNVYFVPEPSSLLLLSLATVGITCRRRRSVA